MKPDLKEDPREWRKFALTAVVIGSALATLAWRRHRLTWAGFEVVLAIAVLVLVVAWLRPRWVRPVYRAAMTGSFYVGQVTGRVMLAVAFLLVLTPLGWALRLFGKDVLRLRRNAGAATYWRHARSTTHLDREF